MKTFVVAVVGLACAWPAHSQRLIHHWDFEVAGVVRDVAGAARDGTLIGGAAVAAGVLRLGGSTDYVQFDRHLVPTSPRYTVALFARAASGANAGIARDFISQGAAGAAFFIGTAGNGTALRAGDNWLEVIGGSLIADGDYHHYALTMSETEASFYIDGALVSTNAPFAGGAGGTPTRLGRGVGSGGGYFSGDLDDVRIYDDALDGQQVLELAKGGGRSPRFP